MTFDAFFIAVLKSCKWKIKSIHVLDKHYNIEIHACSPSKDSLLTAVSVIAFCPPATEIKCPGNKAFYKILQHSGVSVFCIPQWRIFALFDLKGITVAIFIMYKLLCFVYHFHSTCHLIVLSLPLPLFLKPHLISFHASAERLAVSPPFY